MVYKTQDEEFEIKDELLREYEEVWGHSYPQIKFELMHHQALKIHKGKKYEQKVIEVEINNLLEEYNRVGRKMPELMERIEKGDVVHC